MGYLTNFDIKATGFSDAEEEELFQFKFNKLIGVTGLITSGCFNTYLEGMKWYGWEKDISELSSKFPLVMIEVHGVGEEDEDQWKARFIGGDSEVVYAQITFPKFNVIGI